MKKEEIEKQIKIIGNDLDEMNRWFNILVIWLLVISWSVLLFVLIVRIFGAVL